MRLSARFAVIRLVVIVREVKAKRGMPTTRVSADRARDARDKKVNLRRNASTRAPATVEGSCSLLGGSNLLTSAPADQQMLPDQQPTRTPTIERIVQRLEAVTHPRRLSALRPIGALG